MNHHHNNYLVIMAGGIGSRFWPMSTAEKPKQFLDVLGTGRTLLQQTIHRFGNLVPMENVYIVTSASYKEIIREQLPELTDQQVLLEPCMRNTAPCIAYACYKIREINPEARIVVAPSDHLVTNEPEFERVIAEGIEFVSQNAALLTLGIKPHRPETGYGYIQSSKEKLKIKNEKSEDSLVVPHFIQPVEAFKEKPDQETAQSYLASGDFFWNSGIFLWTANAIIRAFEENLPEVAAVFAGGAAVYNTGKEQAFVDEVYPTCVNISVDYGIMEKAENVYVLVAEFGWSDLGTWGSLYEELDKDGNENTVSGKHVFMYDSTGNIVNAGDDHLVVIQGLKDCIVVQNGNIILVCRREDEQKIKQFVNEIKTEVGDDMM